MKFHTKLSLTIIIVSILATLVFLSFFSQDMESTENASHFWKFQSIDTMKYSRDASRDPDIFTKIPSIVKNVADLKASYIAIDTPYDEQFYPVLRAWVQESRKYNLHIWFRGNFSGWEGWFNYPKFTDASQHHAMTRQFISGHPELFQDSDIFTPAPEPENSDLINPWKSPENVDKYNRFLVDSYKACVESFQQINKHVYCGYFSMNADTAKNILTESTVQKIGNIVVIDHYVDSPETMANDIDFLHKKYNAKIVLGEFGAPIPDINGTMTADQQAAFIDSLLQVFYKKREVILGLNYWVITGGSTALINDDGTSRPAAAIIQKYYDPNVWEGRIVNTLGEFIGNYTVTTPENTITMKFRRDTYKDKTITVRFDSHKKISQTVVLEPKNPGADYRIRLFVKNLLHV